jgi:hypothetical protein
LVENLTSKKISLIPSIETNDKTKPISERNFDMSTLEKPLHIDIPVKLAEVKLAFSVPALAFEGDLPASIFHLQLIENDIADWNAKAQVIAVFHTNAGHVTLNDRRTTPNGRWQPAIRTKTSSLT